MIAVGNLGGHSGSPTACILCGFKTCHLQSTLFDFNRINFAFGGNALCIVDIFSANNISVDSSDVANVLEVSCGSAVNGDDIALSNSCRRVRLHSCIWRRR